MKDWQIIKRRPNFFGCIIIKWNLNFTKYTKACASVQYNGKTFSLFFFFPLPNWNKPGIWRAGQANAELLVLISNPSETCVTRPPCDSLRGAILQEGSPTHVSGVSLARPLKQALHSHQVARSPRWGRDLMDVSTWADGLKGHEAKQ